MSKKKPAYGNPTGEGEGLFYLLNEQFLTTQSAPISSPRTCEPGPGTLNIYDTSALINDAGEGTYFQSSTNLNQIMTPDRILRQPGVAVYYDMETGWGSSIGFYDSSYGSGAPGHRIRMNTPDAIYKASGDAISPIISFNYQQRRTFVFVYTSTGCLLVVDDKLVCADIINVTDSYYVGARMDASYTQKIYSIKIARLGGSWGTPYGLATDSYIQNMYDAMSLSCESDGHIRFYLVTKPTSSNYIYIKFRIGDASNFWFVTWRNADIQLEKLINGVQTSVATASYPSGITNYYTISFVDEAIRVTYDRSDGTYLDVISYTSASELKTEEGCGTRITGGAGINLITYPYHISAADLVELDKYK